MNRKHLLLLRAAERNELVLPGVACCLWLLLSASAPSAQQSTPGKLPQATVTAWQLDGSGTIVRTRKPSAFHSLGDEFLLLLLDPEIVDALEIAPFQEEEIRNMRSRTKKWRQDATSSLMALMLARSTNDRHKATAALQRLTKGRDDLIAEITKKLLPFQRRQLKQLQTRSTILSNGWSVEILRTEIQGLSASDQQLSRAIAAVRQRQAELQEQCAREYVTLVESTRRNVSAERWTRIAKIIPRPHHQMAPSFAIIRFQLSIVRPSVFQMPLNDVVDECVRSFGGYVTRPSLAVRLTTTPAGDAAVLLDMLARSGKYGVLPETLPAVDVIDRDALQAEMKKVERETRKTMDLYRAGVTRVDDVLRDINRVVEQYALTITRARMDLLEEPDRKVVLQTLHRRTVTQLGLHWCLAYGTLGKEVGITEAERERIRKLAREAVPKWKMLSRRWETELWKTFEARLPAADRRLLRQAVGTPPESLGGIPLLSLAPAR